MVLEMYSVFDVKAQIYHVPMACHNDDHAKRVMSMEMIKGGTQMTTFPEDFQLYNLGMFNDRNGQVTPSKDKPKLVCGIRELIPKPSGEE